MTLQIQAVSVSVRKELGLEFPMVLKQMTVQETREYYLKKFAEWGKKWEREQEWH